jgi:hypothetical protein
MATIVSNDNTTRERLVVKLATCFGWLVLFGVLGVLATMAVNAACTKWITQDAVRHSRASMMTQVEQIKRGEVKCFVQPDPALVDELLADPECAAKIDELYLGGDVSDERLGRLRELPNLRCIVMLFAYKPEIFLERLQGMATIEELTLEHSYPSGHGIQCIKSFPKLKSLCLPLERDTTGDLSGIKNHPSIEQMVLVRPYCDEQLLSLLKSLPRLHSLTIEDPDEQGATSFEEPLRKALPHCQCSVRFTR